MPHTSEALELDNSGQLINRLDFLKRTGAIVAGMMASNILIPEIARADESPIAAIMAQPGDDPMKVELNQHNLPTADDLKDIRSGFFQGKQFWVDSPAQLAARNYEMMDISEENTQLTQGVAGRVSYTIPSVFKGTDFGYAPKDRGMNSHYAKSLRQIISKYMYAAGFDVLNEPDRSFEKEGVKDAAIAAAELAMTADQVMQELEYKGNLMIPAVSDTSPDFGVQFLKYFIGYLIDQEYVFKTPTVLSVHYYEGAKQCNPYGLVAAATLARRFFPSEFKQVHGTEGGVTFDTRPVPRATNLYEYDTDILNMKEQEKRQLKGMLFIYNLARTLGFASMKNYTEHDTQEGGDGFMDGYKDYYDRPHEIYEHRQLLKEQWPFPEKFVNKLAETMWEIEADMHEFPLQY